MSSESKGKPSEAGSKSLMTTEGLVKEYSRRRVVNGVSLRVGAGEIVGIMYSLPDCGGSALVGECPKADVPVVQPQPPCVTTRPHPRPTSKRPRASRGARERARAGVAGGVAGGGCYFAASGSISRNIWPASTE